MRIGSTAILVAALCAASAAAADVAPVDAARTAAAVDAAEHAAAYGGLMPARTIHHVAIVYGNRAAGEASAAQPATGAPPSPVRRSCG